MKLLGS